jgi:hypothetical protein
MKIILESLLIIKIQCRLSKYYILSLFSFRDLVVTHDKG